MNIRTRSHSVTVLLTLVSVLTATLASASELPDSKNLMRALADELQRSMTLQMEDLEKPYFIQYSVEDSIAFRIEAKYGDLTSSEKNRSRDFYSYIRVGSYELDNTNYSDDSSGFFRMFGGGGNVGRASLPLDDDYLAMRQAIWRASDQNYKDAVETLTKKQAYMKDKKLEDRPPDFSKASVVDHMGPAASMKFDRGAWETRLAKLSARFKKHPQIQDSTVQMFAAVANSYIVNSENTRLRFPDTGVLLTINAELQAEDGMTISDGSTYFARTPSEMPKMEQIERDIDKLVERLTTVSKAPMLERYTGPVLFDSLASAQMLRELVADAVAGRAEPVGSQRRSLTGAGSLEKQLGSRILPSSFRMYDDPTVAKVGDTQLLGHYEYDDEGSRAERVDLVSKGELNDLAMSRVPTKKRSGSNGHGRRSPGMGAVNSSIGCLFLEDEDGVSDKDLKAQLLEAADDEGLDYGLRVTALKTTGIGSSRASMFAMFMRMQQRGGKTNIGDPIYIYKVFPDGREELVRGCEFGQVKLRDLRRLLAGGDKPEVYNYIGLGFAGATPASSIVSPALLFEELELFKIEQEEDTLPILKTPLTR